MRFALCGVAFLLVVVAPPRDSIHFHSEYGEPDLERFLVRPDVTATVEYGSDGKMCYLEVMPRQAFVHGLPFNLPTMSREMTEEVLIQMVPPKVRGKELPGSGGSFQASCGAGIGYSYENVDIGLGINACEKRGEVQRATVHFKRPICENVH
jgi:hypothetical protein